MNTFDLQIQTTASDGKHTPQECVEMAKANGVLTIAITDHDTVAGVPEARKVGEELGVRVIPGIELSIQEHGMHLLGFGIDTENRELGAALMRAAENRVTAAKKMVENFQKGGFFVDWSDVVREAGKGAVVTRPHIVTAVMKRPENKAKLDGISTKYEFFQKYFTNASPYFVLASTLGPREAIGLVHGAGGVAVWSHPPIPDFVENCAELEKFLKELIGFGLAGIELFSPAHTEKDVACLEALALRYHLLTTAGSDFHERYNPADTPWPRPAEAIGDYPTFGRSTEGMLEAFHAALERSRSRQATR